MAHSSSHPATIVQLAHGPTSATLTAARRLETFVERPDQILVIEATPPGATAVDRAADRGYQTHERTGAALSTILDDLVGSVLVIHDDVTIDQASLDSLIAAHTETGLVAVAPTRSDQVEAEDLICAVGSGPQLAALAARAGFGPGMMLVDEFVRPHGVTIAHSRECQRRVITPRDLTQPLLVAALIVRDEQDNIGDCLDSLDAVVDRVEIFDTGSLDRTVDIARSRGANVTEIEWRNDFAWARNQALEACTDAAYMLWIDGDERLECSDPKSLRAMLATYHGLYTSYGLPLRNIRADGTETHSFTARRIADPNDVHFVGALHEQVERRDGTPLITALITNLSIRHLGYDEDVVDLAEKAKRNLEVARRGFETDPSETNAVQLARALKGASTDPNETLRAIEVLHSSMENSSDTVRAVMYGLVAELSLKADNLDDAISAAKTTLELIPADAAAGAVLAEALRRENRLAEIVSTANDYEHRSSAQPLLTDHLAAQTRARIVFEAALRVGDLETARRQVANLPRELDPWPVLAEHLTIDELVAMAPEAASADDERLVVTLVSRSDLNRAHLTTIEQVFATNASADTATLLRETRDDLDTVDTHGELRQQFYDTGGAPHAVDYARSLCAGQVDLGLELDDAQSFHNTTAAALAIAAEAHLRRGDLAAAVTDAEHSIKLWPGSTRAAVIVASAALDSGDAGRARDVIDRSQNSPHHDRLTRDRRHDLARLATRAHLDLGNLRTAIGHATEVVADDGELRVWERLISATAEETDGSTLLLGLALLSDGVEFIDALAGSAAPARTGQLCAAYLGLGGANPDAVSTGVLACVLSGLEELALVIADHGDLLPEDIRERLVEHLTEASANSVAERLDASAPLQVR
ncbi:MAG: glycosyltransferase [Acidimicrobiia bacterium]|nr:glycosyltransferase [Acidimicrobiia bacterium]